MHATLVAALPGDIPEDQLRERLNTLMERFNEQREVALHRSTSVYAEDFESQYVKAVAFAITKGEDFTARTPQEMVEEWNGDTHFDTDGWPLTTSNPEGQWDWWVIGGRWGGAWTLRPGAPDGPLRTDGSSFGRTERADRECHTDCARWRDLAPESVGYPYSYIDLDEVWHTKWIGPSREEALDLRSSDFSTWNRDDNEFGKEFMMFLADLPPQTWLVHIDYHN